AKIAAARAATDWEAVLAKDPAHGRALLAGANLLAEAGRHDDALARLAEVEQAAPGSAAPLLARARVALGRGFEAEALAAARTLASGGSDRCAGWSLLLDIARRTDAARDADAAIEGLASCGGGRSRLVAHRTGRGAIAEAIPLARALLEEDPQDTGAALRLADLLVGAGKAEEAVQILERQEAFWPRNAWLPRRRAEILERMGDAEGARAARERSLALD